MNRRLLFVCTVVASASTLAGCVSVVKSTKADKASPGIRYFLPEVFIQVNPAADGTVTVEKVYLPDPKREYTISASSYLSSHTLEVDRDEKGLLKSVTFNSDSTAVAQQVVTSAASVRSAQIEARTARAKSEADVAKAAADKAKTALEDADKARKAATSALDIAQRKLAWLQQRQQEKDPPKDIADQVFAANLAVVETQAKKDAADAAYNELLAKESSPNIQGANAASKEETWPQALEPVFFRVVMAERTVQLKQAFEQKARATWVVPKTEVALQMAVFPSSVVVRPAEKTGALTKPVHLTLPAKAVAVRSFVRTSDSVAIGTLPVLSLQRDLTSIDLELPKNLPGGDYDLDINITPAKSEDGKPIPRTVKVRIER